MVQHAGGTAGRGGHEIALVGQARGGAVVEHHAVLAAHDAVARLADRQGLPAIGVDPVQELRRVPPLDIDLAQGRGVEDADTLPRRLALARDGRLHVFAGFGEIAWPLPLADILEHRALGDVPILHRRQAGRIELITPIAPTHGTEGDGRIGRPKGGRANLADRPSDGAGQDAQRVDVGGAPLIGTEAGQGVALQMLGGIEALAHGKLDIRERRVVLQIDEALALLRSSRHGPERLDRPMLPRRADRQYFHGGLETSRLGRCRPGARTLGQDARQVERAVAGAGAVHPAWALGRAQAGNGLVIGQLALGLAEQMHRRAQSARDRQQVTVDLL